MKQQHLLFFGLVSLSACNDASGPPDTTNRQHWITLSAGVYHSCGITTDGSAFCWGLNPDGALGNGDPTVASVRPVRVLTDLRFTTVSVGGAFSCGLTAANRAYCWGAGSGGALGDGKNTNSAIPVAVADDHVFTQISVGFEHVCAVTPAGEAFCWGDNMFGELGDGTKVRRSIPTLVGSNTGFKSISAGNLQTCALSIQGKAFCWGGGSYGEVGVACDSVPCAWPTPQPVSGDLTFAAISAGNTFTCAVSPSAEAWCWGGLDLPWSDGMGRLGVLGDGGSRGSAIPVKVAGNHRFTEVVAGTRSTCGVTEGNEGYCWGVNSSGELGIGTVDDNGHANPTRLGHGITWSHIKAGDSSCGLDQQGVAYCWAMIYGDPDTSGGIRIRGLWTSPTLLPDPVK